MNQNVPWGGAFYQVHFVLQTGATTADHRQAQCAFRPTLFFEQGTEPPRGVFRDADQLFVADLDSSPIRAGCPSRTVGVLGSRFAHKVKVTLSEGSSIRCVLPCVVCRQIRAEPVFGSSHFPGRSLVRLRDLLDLGDGRNVLELFAQCFRFRKIF